MIIMQKIQFHEISYTLKNAENGIYGWYAEVTDDFGGFLVL